MHYTVYILYSPGLDEYYTGHTENLDERMVRHTNSGSKATRKSSDWKVVYTEEFSTRSEAMHRELAIKKKKEP